MSSIASVRISVVRAVYEEFVRRGGDGRAVRRRYGLQPETLNNPSITVPVSRYVAMFEDMAGMLADPLFGARIGEALRPADLGPAGLLISRSSSIYAAMRRMTEYFNSLQSAAQSHLSESDGYVLWTYRLEDRAIWPRRQDAEFTLASLIQLLRAGFRWDWQPNAVHFEHSGPATGADKAALSRLLGASVQYDAATNGLLLEAADAHRSHRREDRDMVTVLERYLRELVVPSPAAQSWRARVLALIASGLGQENVRLERLADDLGIAPRSLQRRLAEEGTSLRRLLDEHRAEIAELHLQTGIGSVARLAETLGYADGTAFWRAHRRWSGQSPSERRQAARRKAPLG